MKYPVTMIITTVQMSQQADIKVHVRVADKDEAGSVSAYDFKLKPLDTPEDPEDYARMATAAVCEAL
jgi:hypothetical protein